ncbi:hypothetical protein FKW77_002732 [Venturia effusa]|uniref:Uncharacterized protein n=1 Tax=Venturia effusa TaxID=50376 RepID=A0A517LGR8_9PEZI|nr:hypothetical protein FKW77_002732 [Venturia effusa]
MFLSMLAGDVASAHGHEFSRPATTQRQDLARRLTLPRAVLPSTRQRAPHAPIRRATTPSTAPSVQLTMAELKEEPEDEAEEEDSRPSEDSLSGFRMPGAFHGSIDPQEPIGSSAIVSDIMAPSDTLVQTIISPFDLALTSPAVLTPNSIDSRSAAKSFEHPSLPAVTRRARGPKTVLRFAHPTPPTRPLGKHGLLRPRILLQLQQRRESGFHRPLYDVLPANRFAPRTKFGQKIQRLHKGKKDGLDVDDLVIINAEDYSVSDTVSEEIEIADSRALVGVISPVFSTTVDATVAEFTLENTVWCIKAGSNGASYILESQCDVPQMARWYIPKRKRNSVIVDDAAAFPTQDRKFYFTTILPDSKQHPIIASMTEVGLEVNDSYKIATHEEEIVTDATTRKLIIMSAAWVFFMEGWSNSYKVKPKTSCCSRPTRGRANSLPIEPMRRRSRFTNSPSQSPSLQPTPIEGLSCSSSSNSSEAPSLAAERLPGIFCLSAGGVEPEKDKPKVSDVEVKGNRQAQAALGQIGTTEIEGHFQQAYSQKLGTRASPEEASTTRGTRVDEALAVHQVRGMSQKDEGERKRRSWSHRELRPRVSSLVRTMSHRHKRARPIVIPADSTHDDPTACTEERPPSPYAGARHFRRISQHLRHLNLGKPDATHVTAELNEPLTSPQQTPAPQTRPTTAKTIAASETEAFDNTSPYSTPPKADLDFTTSKGRDSLSREAQSATSRDGAISAAQSTDTLPDPAQTRWWHQYDQFVERYCAPVAERYSLEQNESQTGETRRDLESFQESRQMHLQASPQETSYDHLQNHRQEQANETPFDGNPLQQSSNTAETESPMIALESPTAGGRRLSIWKEKLRTKLHV